jgi:hypothetical protein
MDRCLILIAAHALFEHVLYAPLLMSTTFRETLHAAGKQHGERGGRPIPDWTCGYPTFGAKPSARLARAMERRAETRDHKSIWEKHPSPRK